MFYEGKTFDALPRAVITVVTRLHEKNILKLSSGTNNSINIAITRFGMIIAESIAPVSRRYITTTNNGNDTQSPQRLKNTIKELAKVLINSTVGFDLTPQSLDTMNQILYPDNEQETKAQVIDMDASLRNTMMIIARVNTLMVPLDEEFIPGAMALVEKGLLGKRTKNTFTAFEFTQTGMKTLNRILFDELDFWSDTRKIYPAIMENMGKNKHKEDTDENTFIQCNVTEQTKETQGLFYSENLKTEQQTDLFSTIADSLGMQSVHQLKDAIDFHIENTEGTTEKEKTNEEGQTQKSKTRKKQNNKDKTEETNNDSMFKSFIKAVKNTKGKDKNDNGQNQK